MAIIHEQNDFKREALGVFDYLKQFEDPNRVLRSLTFGDKETFVPLQAADILAYESGKRILRKEGPGRRSFQAISPENREPWVRFYDKSNLHALIEILERTKVFRDAYRALP